jgi:hypothetical protein
VLTAPGTYSLKTSDQILASCGICLFVYGDFDAATSKFAQRFMPVAQGTLRITRADAAGLAGQLQGLRFREVTTEGTPQDVPGGCTVEVRDVRFDLAYTP